MAQTVDVFLMIDTKSITRKRELLPANDTEFDIHRRRDETVVGKKVEIGAGRACDQFYSCKFVDCEIRLCAAGRLIGVATGGSVFEDCLIWPKKAQSIPSWEPNFERCYFRGSYSVRFAGTVIDCDFSEANLISAAFLQSSSLGNVVWPKWPHVVIESPELNHQDWSQFPKPREFNPFLVHKKGIAAVFDLAAAVSDPESFWEVIRQRSYVHTIK